MEEWKEYRLGEIGKIITGKTPRTAIKGNYGGTIPFLTPSDDMACKFVSHTNKTLTPLGLAEVKNCLLPENSICVSCIGSDLGKVVKTQEPSVTNQQINSIIPYKAFDADFVYYLMCIVGKDLNFISKTSTAVPIVNKSTFSNYKVRIPQIGVQKAIGNILSSLDDKIELNRKINSNLEEQAKALFKSWFIDFEPFKGGKFVDSELGKIPEGWEVTTIGDVTENIKEKVGNRNDIKVLSPITSGQLVLSEDYFSKQVFSNSIAKYIVVKHNDFAYNPARINIGSIGMSEFDFDGCVSPVYVVFRCQKGYEYFFDLYRRTIFFTEEVKKRAIGGVRQTLSYKDLSFIQLVYPPKKVIDAFNSIYISLIHTIHSNNASNKKLEAIRDSLLPKLMSGEIEVK